MLVERNRCMRGYVIKFRRVRRSRTRSRKARSRARTISRDASNCMKSGTRLVRRVDEGTTIMAKRALWPGTSLFIDPWFFGPRSKRELSRGATIVARDARAERRCKWKNDPQQSIDDNCMPGLGEFCRVESSSWDTGCRLDLTER